jgi:hypothetical protein
VPRTDAGGILTAQHRQAQAQLRTRGLRDFVRLWPLWQGDEDSFDQLVAATLPLIFAYHRLSSSIAGSYFDSFRRAERVPGSAAPVLARPPAEDRVVASLHVTGRVMLRRALAAGQSPELARRTALVRTSGAVSRHLLAGGRDTVLLSTREDPQALGWARVTDGNPCAFCAMAASRGPSYLSEENASFEAHDHDACSAEPSYAESEWPGRAREFADLWRRAQREAAAAGELDRGTSNDALNAFRRLLSAGA